MRRRFAPQSTAAPPPSPANLVKKEKEEPKLLLSATTTTGTSQSSSHSHCRIINIKRDPSPTTNHTIITTTLRPHPRPTVDLTTDDDLPSLPTRSSNPKKRKHPTDLSTDPRPKSAKLSSEEKPATPFFVLIGPIAHEDGLYVLTPQELLEKVSRLCGIRSA